MNEEYKNVHLGIIGHFGGNEQFNEGQTVKTLAIYDALKRYGIKNISKVDTYYVRHNMFRFFHLLIKSLIHDQKVIVMVSSNGEKILFPLLYMVAVLLKKDIYHYAIGGRLDREVKEHPSWKRYISAFKGNWVEAHALVKRLEELGIKNGVYVPNFKNLSTITEQDLSTKHMEPYRLCMFSRVMPEKGVEDAIEAIRSINLIASNKRVILDIYGAAEPDYLEQLNGILENDSACHYCGVIASNKSVETLKDYYALLFPTHWQDEGIPGTIIDAFAAGIPVIARKWLFCDEMIEEGKTGLSYDFDKPEQLREKIMYAIGHENEMTKMKKNCLAKSLEYREENVIKQITHEIGIE